MVFAIKMLLDYTYMGYWTSLNLNVVILIDSFYQKLNLKIQMLAGKMTDQWEGVLDLFKTYFRKPRKE